MARVVFLGTPVFGVPALEALCARHKVLAAVTQPDRRTGRGRRRVSISPVKERAESLGIPLLQPRRLGRDALAIETLRTYEADLFIIAAYGQILSQRVLDIPKHGTIGIHASLLPKYRGAAPIAAAILNGDRETGVTLMLTDAGMDSGPIIAQRGVAIADTDTAQTLSDRLATTGAGLLIETIPTWLAGDIAPLAQNQAEATTVRLISKQDGEIDWSRSATEIDRRIRAYSPWPGAFCDCQGKKLSILTAHPALDWSGPDQPGTVVQTEQGVGVATAQGLLILDEVQLAGKRPMDVRQFARGRRGFVDSLLA